MLPWFRTMNLAHQMIRAGGDFASYPAVAKGTNVLHSYAEVAGRVACLAGAITMRYGLQPGDHVALILRNCPEYLELLYAAWHAGLVVVPINAKLHAKEFEFILRNSEARLCFASPHAGELIKSMLGETLQSLVVAGSDEYQGLLTTEPQTVVPREADDAAWLFYTSGTTGRPKGAVLSHRNLQTMCDCYFADVDPVAPWGAILHAAPM